MGAELGAEAEDDDDFSDADTDEEEEIHNPLKLPASDGTGPHSAIGSINSGLNMEYTCEICGITRTGADARSNDTLPSGDINTACAV